MHKRKKKRKARSAYQKQKVETDKWCSRYVRIQAAIDFDPHQMLGRCFTCGRIVDVIHKGDSGHYKSRGMGGSSGLYFDERAIRLQCKRCNGFEGGRPKEYRENLIAEADRNDIDGEALIEELERLHLVRQYTLKDLVGLELYYQSEVMKMCYQYNIRPWWR
jgi:hypothetical protein